MIVQSKLYIDLAKKNYSKEQFGKHIEQMMPLLFGESCPDMPKKLIDMFVVAMKQEYQKALKIQSECLAAIYTEPQAATLLAFHEENPWLAVKGVECSILSMQRMMTEFAPGLSERIIEEYEKLVDEGLEDDE